MPNQDTDGNRMIWDETLRQWVPVTGSLSPAELANEINPILSSRYAPLPAVVGSVGQVLAIADDDPLTTEWADGGAAIGETVEVTSATVPTFAWKRGATREWTAALSSSNVLRFRDVVNARDHVTFTPGATADAALADFACKIRSTSTELHVGPSATCRIGTLGTSDAWFDSLTSVNIRAQSGSIFLRNNTCVGTGGSYGAGNGVLAITNATVVPSSNPSGGGILYTEGGALKFRGSSGTVTTVAPA